MSDRVHLLPRVATGIPGLDVVLQGGLFQGSIMIVRGAPGAGKTILTNQIMFHAIRQGGRAAYISLLGESNSRLFAYLSSLSFFQPDAIGDALLYHSASHVVERGDLAELLEMGKHVIFGHKAQVLVIDGLATIGALGESPLAVKQFIRSLQAYCENQQCTAFLLQNNDDRQYHLDTTVDAIFVLHNSQSVTGGMRELELRKLRGSRYLEGRHQFIITGDGIHVYPRTEAVLRLAPPPISLPERVSSGIAAVDTMLGGGFPAASMTMVFGTPGSGRTFLGQYFLMAGAAQNQPGLYVGFNEPPGELLLKADQIGLNFTAAVDANAIHVMWQPAFENIADALIEQMLTIIRQHGVRRLVIDGLEGLQQGIRPPERTQNMLAALMVELRRLHVTTLFTLELQSLGSPSVEIPVRDVSMLADNIIFLRTVELHSELRRLISIQKMRRSDFDKTLREFAITNQGIVIDSRFENTEAMLTGQPRPTPDDSGQHRSDAGLSTPASE
jgi:circadian clock protein KaiC